MGTLLCSCAKVRAAIELSLEEVSEAGHGMGVVDGVYVPMDDALHANFKSANILKIALRRHHISKALQLFQGGSVFNAFCRMVCYFQTKDYSDSSDTSFTA